ncbi:MAG TPA: hypothetical protein VGN69_03995 [Solirubrobacteraceae bacterium]|jgi:hypothetical protein|nr:hypothetical protein [Solirubrobacteraceae bacterium]
MTAEKDTEGIRGRLASRGEDALGKLAQDLLENPLINGALARAFDAREKAAAAQEVAMGALNLPSAADLERLTRRLRSVSQRLEGIEDVVDRIDRALGPVSGFAGLEQRLAAIEQQLTGLGRQVAELHEVLPGRPAPIPRTQERLAVDEPPAGAARRKAGAARSKTSARAGGSRPRAAAKKRGS